MSIEKQTIENEHKQFSKLKLSNITYPILIGLGVVIYMIWKEVDIKLLKSLSFNFRTIFWIFIAILFMFGRDLGYIIRIKVLSEGKLTWLEAFRIIMLWEFTSAVTPSAIGGTSFAIIYVHKEGISLGQSSTMVLLTSFLDELYFVIMFPLLFFIIGSSNLFGVESATLSLNGSIMSIAIAGYILKFLYTIVISYGLFINPSGFKWLLSRIFSLKFLKRWRRGAIRAGNDILTTSLTIKNHKPTYWVKVLSSTFLSWSSRYLVVNCLILGFFAFSDNLVLFARQLVMWIMMLVMPTPGGSGFSEYIFKEYLGEFMPSISVAVIMALLWRLITYYPYLVIGAVILPRWIKRHFGKSA